MPESIHQLQSLKAGVITTKCGQTGQGDRLAASAWHSEITCSTCLGGSDEQASTRVLGGDAGR